MADTVVFQATTLATPPSATIVATDDCGGAGQAQLFKLAVSANGDATPVPATAADGMLVNLGANNDVTVTGTVAVTQSGAWTVAATQSGAWAVTLSAALPAGTNNIGDVDVVTVPADPFGANADAASATGSISAKLRFIAATGIPITGTVTVATHAVTQSGSWSVVCAGDVAHDAADSGNPVKVGGKASVGATPLTPTADGDRTNLLTDGAGRVVTTTAPRGQRAHATTTISNTTETTVLAAGGSGIFHDVLKILVANTSATAVRVDFRDTTAGSVILSIYAPAGQTVGFAADEDGVEQASANTNWTAQASASVTDLRIFVHARKTKG